MARQELLLYIQQSRLAGRNDVEIRAQLVSVGWKAALIDEAFSELKMSEEKTASRSIPHAEQPPPGPQNAQNAETQKPAQEQEAQQPSPAQTSSSPGTETSSRPTQKKSPGFSLSSLNPFSKKPAQEAQQTTEQAQQQASAQATSTIAPPIIPRQQTPQTANVQNAPGLAAQPSATQQTAPPQIPSQSKPPEEPAPKKVYFTYGKHQFDSTHVLPLILALFIILAVAGIIFFVILKPNPAD